MVVLPRLCKLQCTMILCTVTTKKKLIYYALQTSGCGDQEVEMVVCHVTSRHHTEHAAILYKQGTDVHSYIMH